MAQMIMTTPAGFENEHGDQASSTADEIEDSSRRSTTDDFDGDSDRPDSTSDTDSNNECSRNNILTPKERKKYAEMRLDPIKTSVQSDTETRNLLDDIGEDMDEDYLHLQETESVGNQNGSFELDAKIFELSEEQLNYYTNCFLYLMQKTQGFASLQGALQGSDRIILDFFRKSGLDDLALSKIWSLSDINEDGFLNLSEFVTAMHLIILHTKGNMPIPHQLPCSSRPPLTPTRTLFRFEDGILGTVPTNSTDNSNSSTKLTGECVSSSSGNSQQIPNANGQGQPRRENDRVPILATKYPVNVDKQQQQQATSSSSTSGKHHSLSDDHLNSSQRGIAIAKFSDIPPLLVDGHPTALDAATSSHVLPEFARLFVSASRGPPPQPPHRDYGSANGSKGHGRSVSLDLKTFSALSSNSAAVGPAQISPKDMVDSVASSANNEAIQATCKTTTTGTQTTGHFIECSAEEAFALYGMDDDLDTKMGAAERCKVLQRINERLEAERATLMQIRLQVQLRIEELNGRIGEVEPTGSSIAKPTT